MSQALSLDVKMHPGANMLCCCALTAKTHRFDGEFDCKSLPRGLTFFGMKIAVGSDHAGFIMKKKVVAWLQERRVGVEDVGTFSEDRCDYPDYAIAVGERISRGQADRGILICGSGIGMSITANKIPGVRAAECFDTLSAQLSRAHNDANVLCFGGRLIDEASAREMIDIWLNTGFEGGRHALRLDKIRQLEHENFKPPSS